MFDAAPTESLEARIQAGVEVTVGAEQADARTGSGTTSARRTEAKLVIVLRRIG